jgi:hypothetical protein
MLPSDQTSRASSGREQSQARTEHPQPAQVCTKGMGAATDRIPKHRGTAQHRADPDADRDDQQPVAPPALSAPATSAGLPAATHRSVSVCSVSDCFRLLPSCLLAFCCLSLLPPQMNRGRTSHARAANASHASHARRAAREAGCKGGRQQGRQAAREAASKRGRQQGRQAAREAGS